MKSELKKLNLEWVAISKRRLYIFIALLVLTPTAFGAVVYLHAYKTTDGRAQIAASTRFNSFEGEVRIIRYETREVIRANSDTRLSPGDLVQTLESGRASVTLADGATLTIRPNSVVTIAENSNTEDGKNAHVRVTVERGQIKINTESQPPETSNTVETRLTKNNLAGQTRASFDVNEDKSEQIRVSAGLVESRTRGGTQTRIGAEEYVALNSSGVIVQHIPLLDTPVPYAPSNMESISTQGDTTAVTLQWTHPTATAKVNYHIEIASSPFFMKSGMIFERDRLVSLKLVVTQLKQGNYFWRVRAISTVGQASEWSEPQKFTVFRTRTPSRD